MPRRCGPRAWCFELPGYSPSQEDDLGHFADVLQRSRSSFNTADSRVMTSISTEWI
jgi:hypothetical protein